ncbi:MAG: hypothetical protein R3236_06840, partial [Phycisphaeraceae bacterium]|nr:hypothetical protein [Phycisphaeraceae bacterium]
MKPLRRTTTLSAVFFVAVWVAGCGQPPDSPTAHTEKKRSGNLAGPSPTEGRDKVWPLVDRVPAEAVFYIGWRGARNDRRLDDWMRAGPLERLGVGRMLHFFFRRFGGDATEDRRRHRALEEAAVLLWKHPWALWAVRTENGW